MDDEENRNESTARCYNREHISLCMQVSLIVSLNIVDENHIPNFLTVLTEALSNCQSAPVGPFARGRITH